MRRLMAAAMVPVIAILGTTSRAGLTYSFTRIVEEGDGPAEIANGEVGVSQMFVEVSEAGANQTLFTFTNTGPAASSITDVYFDDGTLMGIAVIDDSLDGVSFSQYASPSNLPGGNSLADPFVVTVGFSVDSDPPVEPCGVNPGEYLGILFDLQSGQTYADVINALATGELRIGIHVQGYADGGSESFINDGVIPAPGAILLGSIGTCCVGWLRRHRRLV